MRYENIVLGTFLARPNRFLARVELDGRVEDCHIKNTSRLGELLLPGVAAALCPAANPARKTRWDLVAVAHGGRWVNIDSAAPNRIFGEWAAENEFFGSGALLRPEVRHGASRFDWLARAGAKSTLVEVKGVTLVEGGVARFPGAPTLRGLKHLRELEACLSEGYGAMMVFVAKRDDATAVAPNDAMQPAFGAALRRAAAAGVALLALGCDVGPDSVRAARRLEVVL